MDRGKGSQPDADLIAAAQTGDRAAIDELLARYEQRIYRFGLRMCGDDESARDVLQETMLAAFRNLPGFRGQASLSTWLYQIARHAIIDHYRQPNRTAELDESTPAPQADSDEPDAEDEIAASLSAMVVALPEPYREALQLTEFEGLSQQELAGRLGLSLSGAKSRVQRARQKIKDALLTCCHFEFDRYGRIVDYWEHCCCCAGNPAFS